MKRFSEQLKKKSQSIKLSALERSELRDRLESYMEYHPLPTSMRTKAAKPSKAFETASFTTVRIDMFQIGKFAGAFAAMMLVAVPLMAEHSVPGDVLYPVKVQFNEEVRSSLSLSPYAKVEWETKRLERRVAEARLLASEGKLTPEVEAEVAEAVKEHSDAAQKEIASLRVTDNDEAVIAEIAFTSALDVQSEVLESDIQKGVTASTSPAGRSVLAIAGAVDEVRKTTVAQSGEGVSYEKLLARIELETTRAYEYFSTIEEIASTDEKADVERRLQDIERKLKEAADLKEEGSAATDKLALALADTRKLISFMTNIDVRENVAIDDLVPVTLTYTERSEIVNTKLTLVIRTEKMVAELYPELRVDVAEKAKVGLDELRQYIAVATSSLALGDITTSEKSVIEAENMAADLAVLVKLDQYAPVTETATSTATTTTDTATSTATSTDSGAPGERGTSTATTTNSGE